MARPKLEKSILPHVRIDWEAYYLAFKGVHGATPVKYKGKLLFPDGWQYSAESYQGPEYPPPADPWQVWSLKVTYWKLRKKLAETEIPLRRSTLSILENLQRSHSVPIPVNMLIPNSNNQLLKKEVGELEGALGGLRTRIQELQADREHSEKMLVELMPKKRENYPKISVSEAVWAMKQTMKKEER